MRLAGLVALAALLAAPVAAGAATCRPVVERVAPPVNPCTGRARVRLSAVGDVLLHRSLQAHGLASANGYREMWRYAEPYFRMADISYANLEGPVARGVNGSFTAVRDPGPRLDDNVYTGYPRFNYHPRIAGQLKAAGIDVVSTANNHAMDRGALGVDRTIDALKAAGLAYTGTIKKGAARDFVAYVASPAGAVAFIACSYDTNGISDPNRQVLLCYRDRAELLALVRREAARPDVAGVIVTPHWGGEYSHAPDANQKSLARALATAGATAVIGTHPHVVQPWEWLPGAGGTKTLVIYSTGNFVSGQLAPMNRRTGLLAMLEMCRAPSGKLAVANAGGLPMLMNRTQNGPLLTPAGSTSGPVSDTARALVARHVTQAGLTVDFRCSEQAE
ncbi:CapA family protein [Psychromarinibacter sp. C21-152]|uniref:CapA family protein n=1 Tax=Psychromarinibacter sediminicola TaxID=3033385 RepID=A0AAE3NYY7_9RHOB|nr:CapA family protein [Psychromarinibacter sediminicola]MDF0603272.1 CapA family protein [Psychromarinibacter sediminicola]